MTDPVSDSSCHMWFPTRALSVHAMLRDIHFRRWKSLQPISKGTKETEDWSEPHAFYIPTTARKVEGPSISATLLLAEPEVS